MHARHHFAVSLALHALIAGAFILRRKPAPAEPAPAVMVELAEANRSTDPRPATGSPARVAGRGAPGPAPLPFAALAPRNPLGSGPLRPGETPHAAPDALSPYAASDDVLRSAPPEVTGAIAWVYRKAQLTVGYPGAFVKHGISGQAQARLVFDSTGKLKPDLLEVRADSPYLRVYLFRTLERTFGDGRVPANLVRWKDSFEVFCFVQFRFEESAAAVAVGAPPPIVGNKIFFARRTLKSRVVEKLRWDLGPLHGLLPVPMVGMDVTWFARKWEEHKHPLRAQVESDDLAEYRNDPLFRL